MPSPRPRLYHLYYVLAAFDVATVSVTLALIVWITSKYERSVAINEFWAQRLGETLDLSHLAAGVNAPGNDIFEAEIETPDQLAMVVERQAERLAVARGRYETLSAQLRSSLAPLREDHPLVPHMLGLLQASDRELAAMVEQARAIFGHFASGARARAGEPMARMDQRYASLTGNLTRLGEHVIDIQSETLDEQVAAATLLRRVEYGVAGLIVVMVVAIAIYGHTLARQTKAAARRTEARLERTVAERTAELEASNEQLRLAERLASIGTLAAGLGHDMSNVLFPVRCRLDALQARELDPATAADAGAVRTSVDYLQQLSDGLRLLALDPDDPGAAAGVTDPATWWREVGPLFRTALPRGAVLEAELPATLPPMTIAAHALTQAVFNLVVNAGEALAGEGRVAIEGEERGGHVVLTVRDDGPGMPDEVRRRALDPFFTTKTRGLSTGLGLALVHGAVRSAGGRVEIESEPGRGTAVHLWLPAAASGREPAPEDRGAAVLSLADPRAAGLATALLEAGGYDVRRGTSADLDGARLWITDAVPEARDAARRFMRRGAGRRIVAVGGSEEEAAGWRSLGASTTGSGRDLAILRRLIGDVTGEQRAER